MVLGTWSCTLTVIQNKAFFEALSSGMKVEAKTFWHINPCSLIDRLMIDLILETIRRTDAELNPLSKSYALNAVTSAG